MSEMTKDEVNTSLFDECKRLQGQVSEQKAEIDALKKSLSDSIAREVEQEQWLSDWAGHPSPPA